MKANQVSAEVLLRGIPKEQWALGWEAIMNATEKNIDFETQGRLFSYIKTFIYRKSFNEDFYLQRKKNKETGEVDRKYIIKSLPVTHAMEIYGIAEIGEDGDAVYDDMLGGSDTDKTTVESQNAFAEIELRCDLKALGIPVTFIDRLLTGDRIVASQLTTQELEYLKICRKAYAH